MIMMMMMMMMMKRIETKSNNCKKETKNNAMNSKRHTLPMLDSLGTWQIWFIWYHFVIPPFLPPYTPFIYIILSG